MCYVRIMYVCVCVCIYIYIYIYNVNNNKYGFETICGHNGCGYCLLVLWILKVEGANKTSIRTTQTKGRGCWCCMPADLARAARACGRFAVAACASRRRGLGRRWLHTQRRLGNFTSQDFVIILRSFCANSSSPQISAILVGNFTRDNSPQISAILRKTYTTNAQTNIKILAHETP